MSERHLYEKCGLETPAVSALTRGTGSWRVAASLEKLLAQINTAAPKRSKISDGGIGDPDHANRASDHNPWCGPGVVTARDYTHDPKAGADMHKITEALRQSRDSRIKYVIWNRRIFSATTSPWIWRAYTGSNPHDKHAHVSVDCDASKDSTKAWSIGVSKPKKKFRIVARKVVTKVVSGGKRAREVAKRWRRRGFRVERRERK